ncbi:MAG: hypothetical protein NZM12_11615, partial [Steroidobacteraceae bacterium]|nr:hypothetical protein [Steroidobacteraceae bacterium]
LRAAGAETVAHMLFAPGVSRLFATHPSLPERIKALDPYFDTRELERLAAQAALQGPQLSEPIEPRFVEHAAAIRVEPGVVAARVGNPEQTHLREARVLRRELQAVLRDARHSWISARAAVLSLVLAHATVNRTQQLRQIGAALGEAAAANVEELAVAWQSLPAPLRLPSAQILFVNLRSAPPEELARLRALLHELALADGTQDVFEFCLAELLAAALADLETARPPHGNRTLQQESAAIGRLFAVLASRGATAPIAARQAYEAGISRLLPRERPPFDPPPDWTRIASAALARLERLQPAAKHLLVEALVATIAHDGRLAVAEAELLRAICVRLQCPLPPLLERVSSADDAGALQPG